MTCSVHESSLIGAQPHSAPGMWPGLLCASKAQLHIYDGDCTARKTKTWTAGQACSESSWCFAKASSKSGRAAPPPRRGGGGDRQQEGNLGPTCPPQRSGCHSPTCRRGCSSEAVSVAIGNWIPARVGGPVRGRTDPPPSWAQRSTFWYTERAEFCLCFRSRDTRLHSLTRKHLHG